MKKNLSTVVITEIVWDRVLSSSALQMVLLTGPSTIVKLRFNLRHLMTKELLINNMDTMLPSLKRT